ncbi:MAG: hypothetical protein ABSA83_22970 [Verrucomicrobiota bacterium]
MRITSFRPWLLALSLALAVNVHAAPANLLQQAYGELASADHDYKGHRVAAMRKLQAAGKALGVTLYGNTKQHETQGISDEHLKAAQSLLQQAASGLSGKALKRVLAAEKDISIALSVK